MGSMIFVLANIAEGSLTTATSDGVQSVAQEVSSKVNSWVEDRERELTQLATIINTAGPVSAPAAIGLIDKATVNDPFSELELVNSTGTPIAATGSAGEVSVVGQPWVEGVFQGAQPYAGNVTLNSSGSDLEWLMAAPAATNNLQFSGLLIGVIGLEPWSGGGGGSNQLASLLSGVTGAGGASVSVTAVNSSHHLLYTTTMGTPASLTSKQMLARGALRTEVDNAAIAAALSGAGRSGSSRITINGTDTITGYAEASDVQWAILVSEPASQALSGVTDLRNSGFLVLAVGLVLATLFSLRDGPIRGSPHPGPLTGSPPGFRWRSQRAGRALGGDRGRHPGGGLQPHGRPSRGSDREGAGHQHRPLRLGRSAWRSASNQLAATTARQSSSATETSASMEELARTSGQIAETVERVATQAAETRDKLERAREDILASTERTLRLTDRVRDITRILSMINDLADQTNLLALNAAIEAARAGEAGRGFAVVADEVRRLADRSKTLAADIAQITTNVQVETNATVLAMDKGAEQLKDGLSLMEHVAEASSGIRLATQQQQSATEQVVEAMEQVRIASQQVSTTAQELALASGSQATMAGDLKEVSTVVVTAPAPTGRRERGSRTPATDEPATSRRRGRAPTTPPLPRALGLVPAGSGGAAPAPAAPPPPTPSRPDRSA